MPRDWSVEEKSKSYSDTTKRRSTHICELSRGSGSNLLKLRPTASCRARFKRVLQKFIIVTARHPATRLYLRSRAAIAFEKKRHGRSTHWWVVHPCSCARFVWEIVMTFTYLYCFVLIPYTSAFYMMNPELRHRMDSFMIPAYTVCMSDICLNFVTGYASSNSHEIFLDPGLIASHYARTYFLIDLITSIPYTSMFHDYHKERIDNTISLWVVVIELLPLFKVLRMYTLHVFLKQLLQVLDVGLNSRLIIWLSLLSVLFCHWAACFAYGFPYIVQQAMQETQDNTKNAVPWYRILENLPEQGYDSYQAYLYSFYVGISGLCAIDSNIVDDYPEFVEQARDKLVTCVLLAFGMVYQIYLIVVILQFAESVKAPETRYRQMTNNLKFYIRDKRIPRKLGEKLLDYYEYKYQERYFKDHVIFGSLTDHLKDEIVMHNCRQLMDSVMIFWNLPRTLLTNILTTLKPEVYLPNDVIFKCDEDGDCMYFVGKGTLAVITYGGKEVCHVEDGAYFGEGSLVYPGLKRPVTVIALEECELFRFERKDFKRLIPANSELHQRLRKIVKEQVAILVQIENDELQHSLYNYSERTMSEIYSDDNTRAK